MTSVALTRVLVRILFAALVAATFGAFFIAQRVKRSQPVIEKVRFTRHISPNGDGVKDVARLSFRMKRTDRADVSLVDEEGDAVRRLAVDRELCGPCTHRFRWNGRSAGGGRVPDGAYRLQVVLREQGRRITSPRRVFVDVTPPRPVVRSLSPAAISPDGDGRRDSALVRFEGPNGEPGGHAPEFVVYRTGRRRSVEVARFRGRVGSNTARWDGRVRGGRPAPPGNYLIAVRARDVAGNAGTGPPELPPRRSRPRPADPERPSPEGRPGVLVRYLAARPSPVPVPPGGRARFRIDTDRAVYRWAIRRAVSGRAVRRGASVARLGQALAPRVPARQGVYLLELRAGRHSYRTPFLVRSRSRRRVLVVLPAIAWQARNLRDADEDGWGETLAVDGAVHLRRPLAGGGLPAGFADGIVPLLRSLEREGVSYDVTTDLALARDEGPALGGHAGVAFLGEERWAPESLGDSLREYVAGGGRVAWLGIDSFHRDLRITPNRLLEPGARQARGFLGERTRVERVAPGPLLLLSDRIGFFAAAGSAFGSFERIEASQSLPEGGRLLAGAGREVERPSIAVYRLGRGIVARVGVEGVAQQLAASPGVEEVVGRLWKLLSR